MGIMNNSSALAEEGVLSKGPHTEQRCPTLRTVTVYGYEFTNRIPRDRDSGGTFGHSDAGDSAGFWILDSGFGVSAHILKNPRV